MRYLFTIPILCWNVEVYHVPDLQNMGEYTTEDGGQSARILLQSWAESGPTVSEVQVLLHELVHVAEFGFQIEDLTETQVDVISAVITAGLVSADLLLTSDHDIAYPSIQPEPQCENNSDDREGGADVQSPTGTSTD